MFFKVNDKVKILYPEIIPEEHRGSSSKRKHWDKNKNE